MGDGTRIKGEFNYHHLTHFHAGMEILPHGRAVETHPNGERFEGDFQDGKYSKGIRKFPNGYSYEVEYINGLPHGKGIETHPDGTKNEIEFHEGIGKPKDIPNTLRFDNGFCYQGELENDKPHGNGTLTSPDGKYTFNGEFKQGMQQGKGTFVFLDRKRFECEFERACLCGKGVLALPNGTIHETQFKNDKQVDREEVLDNPVWVETENTASDATTFLLAQFGWND